MRVLTRFSVLQREEWLQTTATARGRAMGCGRMVPEEQHGIDPMGKKASARSERSLGCPRHRQRSLAIFEKAR